MSVESILSAAMQLPEEDRVKIAHELLASVPDQEYLDELAEEIEARAEAVMNGTLEGSDATEALDRMKQALACWGTPLTPMLNHTGLLNAARCVTRMYLSSASNAAASSSSAK